MRKFLVMIGLVATGCAATTSSQVTKVAGPAPMGQSVSTPIVRTATTLSGQPLHLPQGAAEMVASAVDIPAGASTSIHQHPWSRFVYVEKGPLRITNQDTGQVAELQAGQVFPEVVGQWHYGVASGNTPARVIVIDLVPPGATNMVMKPAGQ
jgi:quercetin dioxygenase-like cupin family protein